jgi:sugar lactone lactonase YvrE/DNA-binding IclR family transcriptional regulator
MARKSNQQLLLAAARDDEATGGDVVRGAQALLRGLDVLLAIGTARRPLRFTDLERAVSIPKGSLHRLVTALSRRGLVGHDERTRTYHLGVRVLELSRIALDQSPVIRVAKPELTRLARRLNRTMFLSVLDGTDVFVLDFEEVDPAFGSLARPWPRSPALDAAAGRAIISALAKQDQAPFVDGAHLTSAPLEKLVAELSIAKALGYVVMAREAASARSSVAGVIVDDNDNPIGAIGCVFETDEIPSEELHEAGRIIAEGARRVSGHLGTAYAWPTVVERREDRISPDVLVLATGRDFMGENPVWSAERNRLYWVDVLAPALRSWDPLTRSSDQVELPFLIGGIAFDDQDRLIAAGQGGLYLVNPDNGNIVRLVNPEPDKPDNRFNNIIADPRGRLWGSTMAVNHEPGQGSLYNIGPDLNIEKKIEKVSAPKAVAFSPDGTTLYFTEGANAEVFAFSLDLVTGAISKRSIFIAADTLPGKPNGLTVDSEGFVWVACLGGWCVRRYKFDGSLVEEIALPIPMPTNCAFGGEDLSTLFVTSTFIRLPPGYSTLAPESGQVLAIKTNTRGQPASKFCTKRVFTR